MIIGHGVSGRRAGGRSIAHKIADVVDGVLRVGHDELAIGVHGDIHGVGMAHRPDNLFRSLPESLFSVFRRPVGDVVAESAGKRIIGLGRDIRQGDSAVRLWVA